MLKVSVGAGILTPACPSPEDSVSHMIVQLEGIALRFPGNGERAVVSGSPLVPKHTPLQFPFTKL